MKGQHCYALPAPPWTGFEVTLSCSGSSPPADRTLSCRPPQPKAPRDSPPRTPGTTPSLQMRRVPLTTPATTDILCRKQNEHIYLMSRTSHACATLNSDVSLSPSLWQMRWKHSHVTNTRAERERSRRSRSERPGRAEQHEEASHQGAAGWSCQRTLAFCVKRHYDNEHSLPVTGTSWASFPLMYFREGNGLWQSYLLLCIAGLFREVTLKKNKKNYFIEYL